MLSPADSCAPAAQPGPNKVEAHVGTECLQTPTSPEAERQLEVPTVGQHTESAPVGVDRAEEFKYRPLALQQWFLNVAFGFNLFVVILLITLCVKPQFKLLKEWVYFVVHIFPTVIGTITTAFLEAIVTTLSRITPFIHCARDNGAPAETTIMLPYLPSLGLRDSLRTLRDGNSHLVYANMIAWLALMVLGLKAALLTASPTDEIAEVSEWPLYALLFTYVMINIFIAYVSIYLYERRTGLRHEWDTVNIADHLALFRHSAFLDTYEGSCIATRESMITKLGKMRLKLGSRPRNGGTWYGFQQIHGDPVASNSEGHRDLTFSETQLSRLRFNSVFSVMKKVPRALFLLLAFAVLSGFVAALASGSSQAARNEFEINLHPALSVFLFNFLLTFLLSLYLFFWEDLYLFTAITQPFLELSKSGGATADDALLLNYTTSPRLVAIFDAAGRGHWKIVRTGIMALLQRLLPIVCGASISVWQDASDASKSIIELSTPLSVIVIIYMAVFIVLIPYEVFEDGYARHLPRDCLTIADLVSWTCSSHILRDDNIDLDAESPENGLLKGNPFDTTDVGSPSQKWHMEARLRLAQKRFSFGLESIPRRPNLFMIGIHMMKSEDTTPVLHRPAMGIRKRVARLKDKEAVPDGPGQQFVIAGAGNFTVIGASENNISNAGQVNPSAGGNAAGQVGEEGNEE